MAFLPLFVQIMLACLLSLLTTALFGLPKVALLYREIFHRCTQIATRLKAQLAEIERLPQTILAQAFDPQGVAA
jgi:hypothetical protein